jgi:DNA-binding GntR family transcriptional regulator
MPLDPVKLPGTRSRADELYEWLRAAIISGDLKPSERLVETVIADLASVSRTPVREALHRLEVDGLVNDGGGGLEVNGFSLDELADLCAVREALEGMATELAATTRSALELETLRRITEEEEEMLHGDVTTAVIERRIELNHVFHETLWRASRNRYLAGELANLRSLIERLQDSTLRREDRNAEAVAEHVQIFRAVEAREAEEAGNIARAHFQRAMALRLLARPRG